MTYEKAAYFRVLMLCGYREEFDAYVNNELEQRETLDGVILELSFVMSDVNEAVRVLNEYISEVKADTLDGEVYRMILNFIKGKYDSQILSIEACIELMREIAQNIGREEDAPWDKMSNMMYIWEDAQDVPNGKEKFRQGFESFLAGGKMNEPYRTWIFGENCSTTSSLWKRLVNKIKKILKK